MKRRFCLAVVAFASFCACSSGSTNAPSAAGSATPNATASSATPAAPIATPPAASPALTLPHGFLAAVVANVVGARELVFLPGGDLLVGTGGTAIVLVPHADAAGLAGEPHGFATLGDAPAQGVAYGAGAIYVATQHHLWSIPYAAGDVTASQQRSIASFRQGPVAPGSDGDVHVSASVALTAGNVFIGIGSSCNACTEVDPTRATIQRAALDGSGMSTYATHVRNAIALAVNPATGTLWGGGAGQDGLPGAHPYEYFDAVTTHAAGADYGWPLCEENRHAYAANADCTNTVVPSVELPAYATLIGAAFYPVAQGGPYAFPAAFRGGAFVSAHGSWHTPGGHHVPPRVAYVAMSGDAPTVAVDWNDPTKQWTDFMSGFQNDANGDARIGRPTGIAVGPQGSLFVADDLSGNIYRIRPVAP